MQLLVGGSCSEADNEPSPRKPVERFGHLGDERRGAERDAENATATATRSVAAHIQVSMVQ